MKKISMMAAAVAMTAMTMVSCDGGTNASLKDGVRNGLEKALETCKDDNHRQFLESQLRLMKPYSAAPVVFNASEGKGSNARCAELWSLTDGKGEKSEKKILAALRSDDRAVRTTALLAYEAYADDDFYAKVAKIYRKLSPEAKADVIYWLGKKGCSVSDSSGSF